MGALYPKNRPAALAPKASCALCTTLLCASMFGPQTTIARLAPNRSTTALSWEIASTEQIICWPVPEKVVIQGIFLQFVDLKYSAAPYGKVPLLQFLAG